METVTLRKQGNSVGLTLPAETRIRLGLEIGQELTLGSCHVNCSVLSNALP
ncbi:AbrB/MazE/SpoVT family DNA-binding domain-containing protein [Komagataeibacter melaceti]|uniref:AbrB/MazE/SpoVT family DNA-binding domain-containing protein n=1 Tax=Komagataeibacter melaceti TaxID=2766577 RepID=UPI00237A10C3|nr:AbrB/MazE/SpoVT family DNA-binding domain-containing protein [Komagataeibacter melaceti]